MGLGQQRTDKGVVYDGGIGNLAPSSKCNADFLVRFLVMSGAWKILEVAISLHQKQVYDTML